MVVLTRLFRCPQWLGVTVRPKSARLKQQLPHRKVMNTSTFAIRQLRHQSATAPSRATHAVDAVAARQHHELWSHTHIADWQTIAPGMSPDNSSDLNLVNYTIWSVIQLDTAGNIQRVHYKSINCDVSFSLGSVSTLFRWCGHFLSYMCKTFLPAYNSAKIIKKWSRFFRIMITNVLPLFYGSQCIVVMLTVCVGFVWVWAWVGCDG